MTGLWFLCALAPSFLYSFSNLIDQYIIRHHTDGSPLTYFAFSGLSCIPVAAAIFPFIYGWEDFSVVSGVWVLLATSMFIMALIPFFYAIEDEDVAHATPVLQTTAIFVALFSWVLLGETLTITQILGCVIVVVASGVSLMESGSYQIKMRTFGLMILAAIFFSFYTLSLRVVAPDVHWVVISFWYALGWGMLGFCIFVYHQKTRHSIMGALHKSGLRVYIFTCIQQWLDVLACSANAVALSFPTPAAMTEVFLGFKPFVQFFISGIAAKYMPDTYHVDISRRIVIYKSCCFAGILGGLYLALLP